MKTKKIVEQEVKVIIFNMKAKVSSDGQFIAKKMQIKKTDNI
jgi:hypothetical protein